ncbi:MAG TPA: hypothetical protein VFX39_03090, partial [Gemmatimonadaceae bacterium]|nr:hypothetical protein [Gemmatimonadaceae bacterium]
MSAPAVGPAAPATRRRRPDPSVSQAATVNSVAFVVSVALSFFITPFIIRTLGDARYGTWSLIAQVTGYYGLLDFGVRHAVAYYAASLLATEDDEDVSRLVSSAFWGLTGVALLVLALGAVLMTYFPTWFETAGVESGEIRGAIVIVSMTIALTLPFDVFGAVVNGCRRPDILSGLDVVLRIVTSGLIVLVLYQGGGLVALAGVQFGGKIATWLILSIVARHYVPALSLN